MLLNVFFQTLKKSRFAILVYAIIVFAFIFTLLRFSLFIYQVADIDNPLLEIISAFILGVVSDLGFLSYFFIPLVLYLTFIPERIYQQRWHPYLIKTIFFGVLYWLFCEFVTEWLFWDEFGVRFNFIAVDYLVYTNEVIRNMLESYPIPKLLMGIFVLTSLCFWGIAKLIQPSLVVVEPLKQRLIIAASFSVLPLLTFAGMDQNFHQYSENKYLNELAANGMYQFVAAFKNSELDYRSFYQLSEDVALSNKIKAIVSENGEEANHPALYDIQRTIQKSGAEKHWNVILITVESLSAEYLGTFGNQEKITPFMDEWFKQGLLFTNFYATGTRTIRGLEALTLSYPPTPGHSIVKRPNNKHLFNIGHVFSQHGYDTAFLYGGNGYFDNMNEFYAGSGFRVLDKSALTSEEITFSNAWGVSDDVIFKRTLKEADADYQKQRPFFFQIMTTSNHRPYTYPEGKIDIPSGKGGRLGGVKFTDYAIHQFIQTAKNKPWFNDTLFVMVADHCGGSAHRVELPIERYHIPLFIYAPAHLQAQKIATLSSQIDVAPTLFALLNFSYDTWFYGQDIFAMKPENGRALIANYQKLGLFKGNKFAYLSVQQQVDVILDPLGKHLAVKPETETELVEETKAYYQSADYIWTHRLTRY